MINLNKIPKKPGCYLFKNKKEKIIYIGKAKNLKKRVKSYFQKKDLDIKTKSMLKHVDSLDFIITDNDVEAYILENSLIKKYQPHYNIQLKDAKTYAYIKITNEQYPRALIARNKTKKDKFYGPFISYQDRDYLLNFIKKTFCLRTCKKMPKKPCLRYHIDLCDAPCIEEISKKEYNSRIEKIKMILSGKEKQVLKKMKKEMEKQSESKNFEKALTLRNQMQAIENLNKRQNMEREKKYNEDIINYEIKEEKVYLMLFNIYKGTLSNKNEFVFDYNDDFLEEFIIQYYSDNPVPKEVIIPVKPSDSIKDFLSEKKGSKVKLTIPKRGEKKQLLLLVLKNIESSFFADIDKIKTLRKTLNLEENPRVIECFDISHLSGTSTVGSMVQFRDGKPDKSNYRRFKIRTVQGVDDFKAISEVVKRRYKRLLNEDREFPDLIIIDGGRGQLNMALKELNSLGLKIPIISIAKQFEEIYMPGYNNPIRLDKKDKTLHFIQKIRDEAHRFAIKYNRLLRKKQLIS